MKKDKIDYSLITLNILSSDELKRIRISDKHNDQTKSLATRVLNSRMIRIVD